MVYVKSVFGGWREVTVKQAAYWLKSMMRGSNIKDHAYWQDRIRGISVRELLEV